MRGLLLLLSALLLLESTDGNKEYHQLSQHDANISDKAIQLANKKYGAKHLDFAFILEANYEKRMFHVILKSTSCDKTTPSVHRKDCKIQDMARPQVSCVDCRGNMTCSLLKEKEKIKTTISKCLNPPSGGTHQIGGAHTLFAKTEEEQTGCLGCI
ncbi:cystatin-like protein [Rhinichthys klamathensis goyatoka]|uniref:cystatin-like protein n=1 Tax=Rhinichthys klamathensis goyatoka TaxID=3034132 RepID=UPI0024B5A189|nr:cystatin-like protein [Rhinichthys klamathensis goyatoka]